MEETTLESLKNDIDIVGEQLKEVALAVMNEGISDYPVFIASHQWMDIGKPVFDRDEFQTNWFFFASIIEDFVKRKIVLQEHLKAFKSTYGDPAEKACIFLIDKEEARFIFVPYSDASEEG